MVIVTEGERICGQFEFEAYHRRSSKTVKSGISIRAHWRVRDGKIAEHESFFRYRQRVDAQQGDLVAA